MKMVRAAACFALGALVPGVLLWLVARKRV
jgi:hypothetical protein